MIPYFPFSMRFHCKSLDGKPAVISRDEAPSSSYSAAEAERFWADEQIADTNNVNNDSVSFIFIKTLGLFASVDLFLPCICVMHFNV